ncbi:MULTISPECIES: TetR/AcrR family transcriptional regulator [Chryseobacterium]|uniref:TetR family transcriptional regulator n=1 Tax=Chryseobacterium daecheongense TaxID=192389 RepID=A0A3N0W6R5_9FLAO|nr:TetR/AcrR family transcriptional regulator [Chryseobacterium daecheongense]ROI00695.1 TetR/AcrR family transcriptional regulator [Chryseobacterium daecheongense]TDX94311.1 TetR family transcriptional regulator [Chryseobacterium daecheongense]UOU99988.1 TetR/AcrR family transcriptional regulator [Chryseobacterium daecheongense]
MGLHERRQREKESIRANILQAAFGLAKTEGWASLSMRKIADAIEYSAPVVYDYFENKEAILFEISLNGFDLLNKELIKAKKKYDTPEEQLTAIVDAYWKFAFKNKEYYQLMFGLGMQCSGKGQMKKEFSSFQDMIYYCTYDIIKKNGSNTDNACHMSHALFSAVHGLISIMMMRNTDIPSTMNKTTLDETVSAFIKSL